MLEIGTNLYHLLIFLIAAWAITRFLIAITKIPPVPRQNQKGKKNEEDKWDSLVKETKKNG